MVNMTLVRCLSLVLLLTASMTSFAQSSEKTIHFNGQNNDQVTLENILTETHYRTEVQDSTCEREVPYDETVCEMEPRYDEVCHTIPGRNDCRTVYDRQCRTETRYRQECTTGRSRRVCRREPSRQQCRVNRTTGQNVCRQIPGREVCNTKPGQRTCRQVPHRENVCRNVSRQVCDWIPSRRSCRTEQVGQQQVCHEETRYRTEEYACQIDVSIPYEVTLKEYEATCLFSFNKNDYQGDFDMTAFLGSDGKISLSADAQTKLPLAFVKQNVEVSTNGKVEQINAKLDIDLFNAESISNQIFDISELTLSKSKLSFKLPMQKITKGFKLALELKDAQGKTLIDRALKNKELTILATQKNIIVNISMSELDLTIEEFNEYSYKLNILPIFTEKLAFKPTNPIAHKVSGELFPIVSKDDLASFEESLNDITKIDLKTETLKFKVPKHKLITEIALTVGIDGEVKELNSGDYTMNSTDDAFEIEIDTSLFSTQILALREYNLSIAVDYSFESGSGLPNDYSYVASRSLTLKPSLSAQQISQITEEAKEISDIEMNTAMLSFVLNKSEYLTSMDIKLHIKYRKKTKINLTLKPANYKVVDNGNTMKIEVDLNALNAKLGTRVKYKTSLEVHRSFSTELELEDNKVIVASKNFTKVVK